jgi:beta propeller repeat protein
MALPDGVASADFAGRASAQRNGERASPRPRATRAIRGAPGGVGQGVGLYRMDEVRVSLLLLLLLSLATPAAAAEARRTEGAVIVKLRAEGSAAVRECGERIARERRSFRDYAADGSDSLDRVTARLGIRELRPLFRRPDRRPFVVQRALLRARLARAATRRGAPAPALPELAHVYRVRIGPGVNVEQAVAELARDPHVEWAQPDFRAQTDLVFDDPFLSSSGSWGQPYADLWGLHRIGAPAAWDRTLGEGVVAAVVDTGVDYTHPDLAPNTWVHPGEDLDGDGVAEESDRNGLDDDGNGYVDDLLGFDFANTVDDNEDGDFEDEDDSYDADPQDDFGHGTHVAGTIAAFGGDGFGVVGVAPRARIMALKGLDEFGDGEFSDLAEAIVYAAANGASVINNSYSCGGRCPRAPVIEEAVRTAHALGAVVVFSAGNRADDLLWNSPQNLRETLAVAATREDDSRALFSNRGFLLDVAAPGGGIPEPPPAVAPGRNILSTRAGDTAESLDPGGVTTVGDQWLRLSGTSMSAPHVVGLVALVRAVRPAWGPEQVRAALRATALDAGAPGHDRDFGAGRIRADLAVALERVADALGAIDFPRPADVLSQRSVEIEVSGRVLGADVREWQLFAGAGVDPVAWLPLGPPRGDRIDGGVLARWLVRDLEDGPAVLRLVLRTADGGEIHEFAPVFLERNPARRVSSEGGFASDPSISGDLVAWQSERLVLDDPNDPPDPLPEQGLNLFLTDLRDGREHVLAASPRNETFPSLSGERVVWQEFDGFESRGFFGCRFDRKHGRCHRLPVRTGGELRTPPIVSGARLVWSQDDGTGELDILGCALRGFAQHCAPRVIAPHPVSQILPDLDGDRVVWMDGRDGFPNVWSCLFDASGACPERALAPERDFQFEPRVSGELVVWLDGRSRVNACAIERETGTCDPVPIAPAPHSIPADVSGDRIVWHGAAGGNDEIFFCEWDRVARRCPVQRLTNHPAAQTAPRIDGARVVWQDDRDGTQAIFGFELPALQPLGDRVARARWPLVVPVRARDPLGDPMALSATTLDGGAAEALGARFYDFGDGRGALVWIPRADQLGEHAFTVTALSSGRLFSSESFRVRVVSHR